VCSINCTQLATQKTMIKETHLVYKKSNQLTLMIPTVRELTPLTRKIYTVLLWETQNQCKVIFSRTGQEPSATHTFEARLVDLFSLADESNDARSIYTRAKKSFEAMKRTEVKWHSVEKGIEDEWGIFDLLSQVKIFKRDGETFGQWALPPEIMKRVLDHGHYTLIDLKQIVKLKTYSAISLYEIFARYRTAPGGCTSSHSPEWWTTAISHKPGSRVREWRKVKYETILPALEEISSLTDIVVERPEEKRNGPRNSVTEVYFKIKKKSEKEVPEGTLSIDLVEMASRLSVSLPSVRHVITEIYHGDRIAMVALERLEAEISKQGPDAIDSPTGYFRKIVDSIAIHVSTKPSVEAKKPSSAPELKQSATDEVRQALIDLLREEQLDLLERAVEIMRSKGVFTAQAALKYKAFKEEGGALTPVLLNYMVEVYKSDQPVVQANAVIAE